MPRFVKIMTPLETAQEALMEILAGKSEDAQQMQEKYYKLKDTLVLYLPSDDAVAVTDQPPYPALVETLVRREIQAKGWKVRTEPVYQKTGTITRWTISEA